MEFGAFRGERVLRDCIKIVCLAERVEKLTWWPHSSSHQRTVFLSMTDIKLLLLKLFG